MHVSVGRTMPSIASAELCMPPLCVPPPLCQQAAAPVRGPSGCRHHQAARHHHRHHCRLPLSCCLHYCRCRCRPLLLLLARCSPSIFAGVPAAAVVVRSTADGVWAGWAAAARHLTRGCCLEAAVGQNYWTVHIQPAATNTSNFTHLRAQG